MSLKNIVFILLMGKNNKHVGLPMVSICTPTFNRRPFIATMIKCFEHQTYPKNRMEWIIIDDGTDKIEELVSHIPQVKYFKYDTKMTLGVKRNLLNEKATGAIIVYMDDDDYYPPERVRHAVDSLQRNPKALCAGSSILFCYFKHVNKMIQFGPYGPNHSTAATFAFKRELLRITRFDESSSVAEEKKFLKDYTIPFVQLDPKKSILVVSHEQNSFDKKEMLLQGPNPTMKESNLVPADFIKEPDILSFFMTDINNLSSYEAGKPENKPDVIKQIAELKKVREAMRIEHIKQQTAQAENMNQIQTASLNELKTVNQQLKIENKQLIDKVKYLEDKMKQLISERVQERIRERNIKLSQDGPPIHLST